MLCNLSVASELFIYFVERKTATIRRLTCLKIIELVSLFTVLACNLCFSFAYVVPLDIEVMFINIRKYLVTYLYGNMHVIKLVS